MPTLVNYSGEDEHCMGGSSCSMDWSRLFSVLDVYSRPSKRPRISDSYSLFSDDQDTKPSIEILPDECLYEIFRRLSGGRSRSAAACVSNRWLTLSSNIRSSEMVLEEVKIKNEPLNADEHESDGYLSRSLEGKKATDTRLAAIVLSTSTRGGLGKLSVRGSSRVTSIGLSAIARGCPNLRVLLLWNVPLVGDEALIAISKECRSLENLDLCHCSSISDTGLASIAENCPNLCSLTIESCKKIGNESLRAVARSCPNLQSITIKDCPLVGDQGVATLFSLGSSVLSKVKLQSLHITDLSLAVIGRYGMSITNLALTSLRNVSPKGFWAMGNANELRSLIYLTISACYGITDLSLEAIGNGCGSLKHMALKKCCFVSDNGLVSFAESARFLEVLHLEECNRISQHGILGTLSNQNSKLKSFSIVKCMGIKDQEHEAVDFSESQSLRSLTIKNCFGFGNANVAMVGKLCPHLHNLDLSGLCGITDSGLFELLTTCSPGLVKVNLSDCVNLTNKVVVDLAKIHGGSLEVLNLEGCRKIGDESLSAIAENCFLLKDLDVSKCGITDFGVSCLSRGRQTDLRVLSLSGCSKISNASLSSLEKLGPTLLGLNLQRCNLISSSAIESLVVNLWRCDILS
ncbi:EIN3-binding F-box protein 2-like [Cynara cardunculus var. scolymus]|uniref:EIN3-binding F-box protein 2-like n=1 Tax=Cynara cardunculus var. scolymus TaxID=59895 RepID=UPI000D6268CC|nr:EIN3-binding F-box protein 2-like [Cynara cardunculus var. scolymus]